MVFLQIALFCFCIGCFIGTIVSAVSNALKYKTNVMTTIYFALATNVFALLFNIVGLFV